MRPPKIVAAQRKNEEEVLASEQAKATKPNELPLSLSLSSWASVWKKNKIKEEEELSGRYFFQF